MGFESSFSQIILSSLHANPYASRALQQWIGLSDPELEKQALNRLDFQSFLGYPEQPPDYSTVWQFRERLAATRTDSLVWAELLRLLDAKGLRVRKGVAQDASLIEANPGPSGEAAWG